MKKHFLEQIIDKKNRKEEFAIITNISTGESFIFEKNKTLDANFEKYSDEINDYFENKKNGMIENTDIFIDTYFRPTKVDDPALKHALKNKFLYIGALGSKTTHLNRCQRLREAGFKEEEINSIHGPIGIKLGGKSAPEIALSIIAQLVSETYKS